MNTFSYHLVKIPFTLAVKGLFSAPINRKTKGLIHSEYMTAMTLGSPILSSSRFLIKQVAIFAQWENEEALENYLNKEKFGRILNKGSHVRLAFIREWGKISGFKIPEQKAKLDNELSTVVAVTIARMKPFAIPRFLKWGRPVEKLVCDHSGTLLSLASIRFPNTISNYWFTISNLFNLKLKKRTKALQIWKSLERKNNFYDTEIRTSSF